MPKAAVYGTLVLVTVLALSLPTTAPAQGNPFFRQPSEAPAPPAPAAPTPRLQWLVDAQRTVRGFMSAAVNRRGGERGVPYALLAFSFLYGFLHALGPGHRKVALAAYFLARPGRVRDGVAAGSTVALLHAVSAVAVVYGLFYLVRRSVTVAFSSLSSAIEAASYGAILLLGFVLLVLAVRHWRRQEDAERSPGPSGVLAADSPATAGGCPAGRMPGGELPGGDAAGKKTLLTLILTTGLVPCPGTAMVLIFCLSQGLPVEGVLSALALSSGMAVVTVGVSVAAILGKRRLLAAIPSGSRAGHLLHHGIEVLGALLVVLFGLLMLLPWLAGALA